jgi:hypothetical protein
MGGIIIWIVMASAIAYLSFRLNYNPWVFLLISVLLSPVIGLFSLATWDYYKTYIKGKV